MIQVSRATVESTYILRFFGCPTLLAVPSPHCIGVATMDKYELLFFRICLGIASYGVLLGVLSWSVS